MTFDFQELKPVIQAEFDEVMQHYPTDLSAVRERVPTGGDAYTRKLAAIEAIYHGQEDVKRMVASYDRNRHLLVDGLNRINGFSCVLPRGAFYAFPNITGFGMSSAETAEYILEKTHVVTSPGSAFGPDGEGFIRICYASRYEQLQEALERMEKAFGTKSE